jgi:hypothetical protein
MNNMLKYLKSAESLDPVTHSVRATQAVLSYGVGAMVDFPDQILMTSALEFWSETQEIFDDRLAKALGVTHFVMPKDISYVRFPEWYFCPRCYRLRPIKDWVEKYRKSGRKSEKNEYMVKNIRCAECYMDLVAADLITMCEFGHIDDFPWVKWVHFRNRAKEEIERKEICYKPELKIRPGQSEDLQDMKISCVNCKASTSLFGVWSQDALKGIDSSTHNNKDKYDFLCEGRHPHKNTKESCGAHPKIQLRGASSVYFPAITTSLVIPPFSNKLNSQIEESSAFSRCVENINDEDEERRNDFITERLLKWSQRIALEIGVNPNDVEKILRQKWLESSNSKVEASSPNYRIKEYSALTCEITAPPGLEGDFFCTPMDITAYGLPPAVKGISLIEKIKVVSAHLGFSRVEPIRDMGAKGFVSTKEYRTSRYPGYQVKGEGIFIEFCQESINGWIAKNPSVIGRVNRINSNYELSLQGKSLPRIVSPKFILLHTISHLLIKQLSFECGYSIASLCERIYCSEKESDKEMAGIFIYTAAGDSEGTLGGLVRQGQSDTFPQIFNKAIAAAKTCGNDPVCILSHGQGQGALNLAACHACVLLPETCCEERNLFLDRGLVIGTFENRAMGFFN